MCLESLKGKYWKGKNFSVEHRKKIVEGNTGKKISPETKAKMSIAAKRRGGYPIRPEGFQFSEESKQKMRLAHLEKNPTDKQLEALRAGRERPKSLKERKQMAVRMQGENCPFWKGGIAHLSKRQEQKNGMWLEYNLWREQIFERDNYTCQFCGTRGGRLNADHIKPWILYPELRFDISNGRTLCIKCHTQRHKEEGGIPAIRRNLEQINAYLIP
jgi:hypothetical protein